MVSDPHGTGLYAAPWRRSDAPVLEPACADGDISRFTWVPPAYSPQEAEAWVAHQHERLREGQALILAIEIAERDLPVGMVGLFALDEPRPRIGYWIIEGFRGRGLAREAARRLMTWTFAELAPDAVQLDIEPHNVASQRVARQLGGRPTGRVARTEAGRRVVFERYTIEPGADSGR
ncbi:MAG TPA: GNAT family N-acetyltransferase [Solirubrobacteraceae bacterium]